MSLPCTAIQSYVAIQQIHTNQYCSDLHFQGCSRIMVNWLEFLFVLTIIFVVITYLIFLYRINNLCIIIEHDHEIIWTISIENLVPRTTNNHKRWNGCFTRDYITHMQQSGWGFVPIEKIPTLLAYYSSP